ncbi:MAG: nucleotidyltransferase domain-containing protein [Rectinemataceae bacterium]
MKVKDPSLRQPTGAGQIKIAEIARVAVEVFQPTICIIYLYGSRATGTDNEESDFDFPVAADRPLAFGERRRRRAWRPLWPRKSSWECPKRSFNQCAGIGSPRGRTSRPICR